MGHFIHGTGLFLVAVFGHWQIWASGGGFGGMLVLGAALFERFTGRSLSKRTHIALFIVGFFLCACLLSWIDEHDRAERLQAEVKDRSKPASILINVPPAQVTVIQQQPTEPKPSTTLQNHPYQPAQLDPQILELNTTRDITIVNPRRESIFIQSFVVEIADPYEHILYNINQPLIGEQALKYTFNRPTAMALESLDKHAAKFAGELTQLATMYAAGCIDREIYSASDAEFVMMRDHYAGVHRELDAFEIRGKLDYRLVEHNKQLSLDIPVMLVLFRKTECQTLR
jgi:hypothetical protein